MPSEVVYRFLASLEPWPGNPPFEDPPTVDAWQAAAAAVGVPCPFELCDLAVAHATRHIWSGCWELLHPAAARDRSLIESFATTAPCLAPLRRMLPVFTSDGDVLLLDGDGRVRRWSVAFGAPFDDYAILASSFSDLLEAFIARAPCPFLWSAVHPHNDGLAATWVDGIEYVLHLGHHHEQRDGMWTCITYLQGDLAPHYFRYPDGPGSPPLTGHVARARAPFTVEFTGDPETLPRALPVGVVQYDGRELDITREAERFIRSALARGWTGRDGKPLVIDGWYELERAAPARTR